MHHLLRIDTRSLDSELISARLWLLGVLGVEEATGHLRAAFRDAETALNAAAALGVDPLIEEVDDREGLDTWREFATPAEAGQFVICPAWIAPTEGADAILIDPGYAFGSGSHPSTRLAIEALCRTMVQGATVLDVGCGSGVLSVAAAKLGAIVTAVDVELEAVNATRANASLNGCEHLIEAVQGSASDVAGRFDVVVVNVTIDIHDQLTDAVALRLGDHSTLIAAGVLAGQQDQRIVKNFPQLDLIHRATEAEWAAVTMRGRGQVQ